MDDCTRFRWFSITKIATAMAVLTLVEQGRLDLDRPIERDLPWLRTLPASPSVTPRLLLSHAAGLPNPLPVRWVHPLGTPPRTGTELARSYFAPTLRLRSRPGATTAYTNLGYLVLEALVQSIAQRGFASYLREAVLDACGLAATSLGPRDLVDDGDASGHERARAFRTALLAAAIPRARQLVRCVSGDFVELRPFVLDGAAYGGLVGSLGDLVRLGRVHLGGGLIEGRRVLSEHLVAQMQQVQSRGAGGTFGLGWWLGNDATGRFVEHGGEACGFRAVLRLYPEQDLGFAALANAGACDLGAVLAQLRRRAWAPS